MLYALSDLFFVLGDFSEFTTPKPIVLFLKNREDYDQLIGYETFPDVPFITLHSPKARKRSEIEELFEYGYSFATTKDNMKLFDKYTDAAYLISIVSYPNVKYPQRWGAGTYINEYF